MRTQAGALSERHAEHGTGGIAPGSSRTRAYVVRNKRPLRPFNPLSEFGDFASRSKSQRGGPNEQFANRARCLDPRHNRWLW